MKRFLRPFVFVLIAIYNAICVVTGGASLKKLVPTGVINSGILGGFSGKVGPVVGGKWKDIDYMRSYVIPANPNTTAQQAVRAKFANLVAVARTLLSSVLQTYWDQFYSNMSGFNAWISQNYALSGSAGELDETAIMAKGTLEPTSDVSLVDYEGGNVNVTWDGNVTGNGLATDLVGIVLYHAATNQCEFFTPAATRTDEAAVLAPAIVYDTDDFGYVFFFRGTGSELVVSDSLGLAMTVT